MRKECWVLHEYCHRRRDRRRTLWRDNQRGVAICKHFRRSCSLGDHDWYSGAHRLKNRKPPGLEMIREKENVMLPIHADKFLIGNFACKSHYLLKSSLADQLFYFLRILAIRSGIACDGKFGRDPLPA